MQAINITIGHAKFGKDMSHLIKINEIFLLKMTRREKDYSKVAK